MIRPTLAIVPARVQEEADLEPLLAALVSLRTTAPEVPVLIIEDAPAGTRSLVEAAASELECAYVHQDDGAGLGAAAVGGLEYARDAGMDAILVGQDVQLPAPGWAERLSCRLDTQGRPAAIVGGRVDCEGGLVQSAGFYYSVIKRRWLPRFGGVPAEVPEIGAPTLCPVAAGLTLIRNETLAAVGFPDTSLQEPHATLDLCLRAFAAGLECVYEPAVAGRRPVVATGPSVRPTLDEQRADAELELRHAVSTLDRFIPDAL